MSADKTFALGHTYADNGTYVVRVAVTDDDGGVGSDTATVTVRNVAPFVEIGSGAAIDEGGTFLRSGSFSDPGSDTWTGTVDYGDGSGVQPLALNPDKTFDLSHIYADDGSYFVRVAVADDDGGSGAGLLIVTVRNVSPSVSAGADGAIFSGQTFTLRAEFRDPGVEDGPWSYVVDWGDGSSRSGTLSSPSSNTILAGHQYFVPGAYTVAVRVVDKDGAAGHDDLRLDVQWLVVRIDVKPGSYPNTINVGSNGNVPVAVFTGVYEGMVFDSTTIDRSSVRLAGAPALSIAAKSNPDLNGDGKPDAQLHFDTPSLQLSQTSTEVVLTGKTTGNVYFVGSDSVRVVPSSGSSSGGGGSKK